MNRVLFINRSYWPDCEATGQLLTELCEDLAETYEVQVICGQPNQNPDGIAYKSVGTDVQKGVRITRVPHTRFDKSSRRRWRALNMLSFVVSATFAAFMAKRPHTVVVETDPPLLCLLGYALQKLRRCQLVVYLQDIYPDVAVALGQLPRWFPDRLVRRIFFAVYRSADKIVVLSSDMRANLIESGIDSERLYVVPNWVDTRAVYPVDKAENEFRAQHGIHDEFLVMYSGNMGLSQRLDTVVSAAELLKDRTDILFAFVGNGATRRQLEDVVAERGLENVRFYDYQPKSLLAHSLSAADLQIVLLAPRLQSCLMPSKTYSVLAAGVPIVTLADADSELARLVDEESVGIVCDPDNARELANAILKTASDRGASSETGGRARTLAVARFDRTLAVSRFVDVIQGLQRSTGFGNGIRSEGQLADSQLAETTGTAGGGV